MGLDHYDGTNYYYRCSKVNHDLTTNTTMTQTTTTGGKVNNDLTTNTTMTQTTTTDVVRLIMI